MFERTRSLSNAALCVNFVILLRPWLCVKFDCSIITACRNYYGGVKLQNWSRDPHHAHLPIKQANFH